MCCFGSGVAIVGFYGKSEPHVLDYTFAYVESSEEAAAIRQQLSDHGLDSRFSDLFEIKIGMVQSRTGEDREDVLKMDRLMEELDGMQPVEISSRLLNNMEYYTPYLISLSGYNRLLAAADMQELKLDAEEAAVYMDSGFSSEEMRQMLNRILETKPEALLDGDAFYLTGPVQTTDVVTDRSITLAFALIVPDEMFEYYTQGECEIYLDGVLDEKTIQKASLMSAISDMNRELDKTGLQYESYLQNMGRQLFYMVAASYLTVYLAIIFLIIANFPVAAVTDALAAAGIIDILNKAYAATFKHQRNDRCYRYRL